MKKVSTLCIVHKKNKILLGMKKRGFGEGKWNGLGGKVMPRESIKEAATRECFEEAGIKILDFRRLAVMDFKFQNSLEHWEVHLFKVSDFLGTPLESEEMKPAWFDLKKIPFDKMWPDDVHWMPLFLDGKKFKGKFLFDENNNILEKELFEVKEI